MGGEDFFDTAFVLLLITEGGYGDDPNDAGGETKYGISKARFPDVDIKNLTVDGAKALYRKHYWNLFRCGELPWPLAYVMFDCFVQFSPGNPTRWLQAAVGAGIDGVLGPKTIAAAQKVKDPIATAVTFLAHRGEYRLTHPKYAYFGKGWRRLDLTVAADAARFHRRAEG